jgi:hypothetical protein
MHRHYGLDVTMGVQRVKLIDSNIRENCKHFIEVQSIKHEVDAMGRIIATTWKTREFVNWVDVEDYLNTGNKLYSENSYHNEGNIFECFDSYGYFESFLPCEGKQFNYLDFNGKTATESEKQFYQNGMPDGYRSKAKEAKKK